MATSRTGTSKWLKVAERAIREAQASGLTHCPQPGCGVPLDYEDRRAPNGAQVDHILAHKWGGQDHIDNAQVMCRTCNLSKGSKMPDAMVHEEQADQFPLAAIW